MIISYWLKLVTRITRLNLTAIHLRLILMKFKELCTNFAGSKIEQTQQYVTSDYNPFSSVSLHISNLKWDTLEDRCNKSRLCMFYKMTHNQAAIPYHLYIQPSNYLYSRHSNTMKFCQCYAARILINSLYFQILFHNGTTFQQKLLTLNL